MKRLAYGEAVLVPMAAPTSLRKCLSMNEMLLNKQFNKLGLTLVYILFNSPAM